MRPCATTLPGELSLRCTGPHVMTQWAYQDEIVPEEIIPENKRLDVLAENDEFVVVVPPPEATARIRVLEREFALDHADCLRGHSMHLAMAPDEWCGFAGIPVNEAIPAGCSLNKNGGVEPKS